jgi:hypothetical protein
LDEGTGNSLLTERINFISSGALPGLASLREQSMLAGYQLFIRIQRAIWKDRIGE